MNARQRMRSKIMITAGTVHGEPTDDQLDAILRDIINIRKTRAPTGSDWSKAIRQHVPSAGTMFYGGEDTSDLNMLLIQILNSQPGGGNTINKANP
jgi:hypothetical protein